MTMLLSTLVATFIAVALGAGFPCTPHSPVCCNPYTVPAQLCPGGVPCAACGGGAACECPSPGPGPVPPSPSPPISETRLTIVNGCKRGPMWIAHDVAAGPGPDTQDVRIEYGGSGLFHTGLHGGGLSATRFWPKMGCDVNGSNCSIGGSGGPQEGCVVRGDDYSHCAPPVDTKFEATFATPGSDIQDCVDMSLVDGYTLPFKLEVSGGSCTRHGQPFHAMDCSSLSMARCPTAEVLDQHSKDMRAIDPKTGKEAGCYSPCMKLTDDKWNPKNASVAPDSPAAGPYCCAGAWGNPDTCKGAGKILHTQYVQEVKHACEAAYSYAYDDKTATIVCTTATKYTLTFYCLNSN